MQWLSRHAAEHTRMAMTSALGEQPGNRSDFDLILASTSRYRQELLARLGVTFRALAPACDEEALKDPRLKPQDLAEALALAKAESLSAANPQATIIGGDQVAALGNDILGKPGTIAAACEQLARMAGREHLLITAMVVLHRGHTWRHTDITRLTMRALTPAHIARYVEHDQPLDCAGSYKLERRGIALFSAIASADHSAVTGLPLIALTSILDEIGYRIP